MAKQIHLTYQGKDYTLEFTRRSVEQMEAGGFNIEDIDRTAVTSIRTLFAGAFLAHHKWAKTAEIEKMYDALPNKHMLLETLIEMYAEPINAMFDEPDEEDAGNATWDVI